MFFYQPYQTDLFEFWQILQKENRFISPSSWRNKVAISQPKQFHQVLYQIVQDFAKKLPFNPLDFFDAVSAERSATVVYYALGCLYNQTDALHHLEAKIQTVPKPETIKEHITQGAIQWFALPIARQLSGKVLTLTNQQGQQAKNYEAITRLLIDFLGQNFLNSSDIDWENLFLQAKLPQLQGVEFSQSLRYQLGQNLASRISSAAIWKKRQQIIQKIVNTWQNSEVFLHEMSFFWEQNFREETLNPLEELFSREILCLNKK